MKPYKHNEFCKKIYFKFKVFDESYNMPKNCKYLAKIYINKKIKDTNTD